jgi:type II secretory pathway component PulF
MVAAGEESGALGEALGRLADHVEEAGDLRAQVRSALVYPALMGIVTGAGVIVLLLFVIPRFVAMLGAEPGSLPFSTRMLVAVSGVVTGAWPFLLVAGVAVGFGARAWLGRAENVRRWHAWRLKWPLVGELEVGYSTARFARALGMLLRSGRPTLPALRAARGAVSNLELSAALERAGEAVSHGQRVHVSLAGTLPPLACELIAVGEESGRLDELCMRVADAYDGDVRRTLRALVAVVEPVLILVFGVVVGFVALAMLQAIYGIDPGSL